RGYARGAIPAGHRGPSRESSSAGDGDFHGRHANLDVGRDISRLHGRLDAARELTLAYYRTKLRLAQDALGRDSRGSRLARWRISDPAPWTQNGHVSFDCHGKHGDRVAATGSDP